MACTQCHFHKAGYGDMMYCCGCGASRRSVDIAVSLPRTQKARGIKLLDELIGCSVPSGTLLVQATADINPACGMVGLEVPGHATIFARPCPTTPRHGFVESRIVKSEKELTDLFTEAQAADPKAEIILMPKINAVYNAIFTPGQMAIGPGHDGATGGKHSQAFPLSSSIPPSIGKLLSKAGIIAGQQPYLELVYQASAYSAGGAEAPYAVQLRGGPACTGGADYIPKPLTVATVIAPEEDLLKWEQTVQGLKAGTVVYGPGYTLASHAAVHCVAHGIPFFTSRKPIIGEVLTPNLGAPWDLNALQQGIGMAAAINIKTAAKLNIDLILYGMHHAVAMQGKEAYWLGMAAGLMFRFGLAAALGEWRHRKWPPPTKVLSREQIYERVLTQGNWLKYRSRLPQVTRGYFVLPWGGAFGGVKWGQCAYSLFNLDRAIQQVLRAKTSARGQAAALRMLAALNQAVDQAHNGGWWMNKFGGDKGEFDWASRGEWIGFYRLPIHLLKVQAQAAPLASSITAQRQAWVTGRSLFRRPLFRFTQKRLVIANGTAVLSYHVKGRQSREAEVHSALDWQPSFAAIPPGIYTTGIRIQRRLEGTSLIYRFFYQQIDLGRTVTYKVKGK